MFKRTKINSIKLGSIPFNEETGKYERDKTDYRTSVEWIDKANKDYERENAE